MKSTVAIYNSHWTSLDAVEMLKSKNYPVSQISIMGQAKIVDDHANQKSKKPLKDTSANGGIVLGSTMGVLPGVGIFNVPGFGYVFGAGAVRQMLDSFDAGTGKEGIVSILKTIGIKKDKVEKYSEQLNKGKFLVIAQGTEEDVEKAKNILCNGRKQHEFIVH
ncbi:MAG: hypothetical protein ABR968_08910 [Bacteroidales bacterium]|jgi:hypothetical protein